MPYAWKIISHAQTVLLRVLRPTVHPSGTGLSGRETESVMEKLSALAAPERSEYLYYCEVKGFVSQLLRKCFAHISHLS